MMRCKGAGGDVAKGGECDYSGGGHEDEGEGDMGWEW
jgi:hypothetical protein